MERHLGVLAPYQRPRKRVADYLRSSGVIARLGFMRVGLDHVHIFASNLSATVEFFRNMFGATVVWDETAAGVRNVRLALGKAFVQVYDQAPKKPRGGAMHHLGIETDDLDALVSRMRSHGFHFQNPIRDEPKFRYVMIAGPDDLLLELFQVREPSRWQL